MLQRPLLLSAGTSAWRTSSASFTMLSALRHVGAGAGAGPR
jgi:hypothetical protein